jgi:hypothetical protein
VTCADPSPLVLASDSDLLGFCLDHTVKFVRSLPADWLEDDSRFHSSRRREGDTPRTQFEQYALMVHQFDRCENCPVIPRAEAKGHSLKSPQLFSGRLGKDCYREARASAEEKYKPVPTLTVGIFETSEEFDAAAILYQASFLNHSAWVSEINTWPRCENCPVPAKPVPTQRDNSIESAVLNAMAARGAPISIGDLIGLKIRGFTKNSSSSVLRSLSDAGAVTMTTKGPAKFFELG